MVQSMLQVLLQVFCHGRHDKFVSSPFHAKSIYNNQPTDYYLLLPPVIINTRPVERAAPLTHYLQAAGMSVVEMPMLTLQSRPMIDSDIIRMQQWLSGEYKALVIVSPTAAASGLAAWQTLEHRYNLQNDSDVPTEAVFEGLTPPSHLIAVGDATASVLNNAKIKISKYQVCQPKVANNEGMLAMPEIENLQAGDKILIWRGLGGRRLLVDSLQARGVHVDSIAWYERKMPVDAMGQYHQWLADFLLNYFRQNIALSEQPKPIVIVSSGAAFEHWVSVVSAVVKKGLASESESEMVAISPLDLADFSYVVLGERLANMVAELNLRYWRVEDLAPETILAAIRSET